MLRGALRAIGRALGWALAGMLLLGLVLYVRYLRSGPDLEPWHRARLDEELTAARGDEVRTIEDYRALEARLSVELDREVYSATEPEDRLPYNRYYRGSHSDPRTWPLDWNWDLGARARLAARGRPAAARAHRFTLQPARAGGGARSARAACPGTAAPTAVSPPR